MPQHDWISAFAPQSRVGKLVTKLELNSCSSVPFKYFCFTRDCGDSNFGSVLHNTTL